MSALEDILAKYPADEVSAALPVIYLAGAAAPLDQISPRLNAKITQAMSIMGVNKATTPEEVAMAIARYCVDKRVNAALLLEVSSTYQQGRTADILRSAAGHVEEAVKLIGGEVSKSAPAPRKPAAATVKAKRGLKKK